MKICAIFLFFQVIFASRIHDELLGKSSFTRQTLDDFLRGMNELTRIERQINEIQEDVNENYKFEDKALEIFTGRPWQIPYLFEGDIILTPLQLQETINYAKKRLAEKNGEIIKDRPERTLKSSTKLRWTTFPISFSINSGVNRTAILAGLKLWQDNTCLTFRENGSGSNRIQFFYGSGCYSSIGMIGGTQKTSIGLGCDYPAIVAHEIGHSLGYYHEQARFDRDNYVQILTQNIRSGMESQYSKQSPSTMITFGVPYDYGSVMHYDPYGFTSNNQPTIQTLDLNFMDTIGQRTDLSFNDVKKMNFAYCNSTCPTKLTCQRGGYTDPKDCTRCRCPDGLSGTFCNQPLTTNSNCGNILLAATPNGQTLTKSGSANCNYLIQAPIGQHVVISIDNVRFNGYSPCETNYVEIKYGPDITDTGARFCDGVQNSKVTSGTNEVLVIFKSAYGSASFAITFSSDGPAVETTTTTTESTTTSSTDTTTTTATTTEPTTTTPATTTEPTTTTTATTTESTTTTTQTPWTTTTTTLPFPWTTTTRRPWTTRPTRPHRTTTKWGFTTCPPICIWGGGGHDGRPHGKDFPPICPEYCFAQNPQVYQKENDSSDSSSTESQPILRSTTTVSSSRFAEFDKKLEEIKKEAIKMMIVVVEDYRKSYDAEVQKKKINFESQLTELKKFLGDVRSETVASVSDSSDIMTTAEAVSETTSSPTTVGFTDENEPLPMTESSTEEVKLDGSEKSAETTSRVRRSSFAQDFLKSRLNAIEDLEKLMGMIDKYQKFFHGKIENGKQEY